MGWKRTCVGVLMALGIASCSSSDEPTAPAPGGTRTRAGDEGAGGGASTEDASTADSGGGVGTPGALPSLMLIVDTSGSMERPVGCVCADVSCETCDDGRAALPDCTLVDGPDEVVKNRWATLLEALTGSFEDFGCETVERTRENGATYDIGYYVPYDRPTFTAQARDGILDDYVGRVRFGVGTFDGWDTYVGAPPLVPVADFDAALSAREEGLWSIGGFVDGAPRVRPDGSQAGVFRYPNATVDYMMDTGLRSGLAADGPLSMPGQDPPSSLQESLLPVRPYGGTPIAAALDDLHYLYTRDDDGGDVEDRYALLITDGYPNDDYRDFGCDCTQNDDPDGPGYCGGSRDGGDCDDPDTCSNHPSHMKCPYPTPAEAARLLVEGYPGEGPALSRLYVVVMSVTDDVTGAAILERLDAIAAAGGTTRARRASTSVEIRDAIRDVLSDIGVD